VLSPLAAHLICALLFAADLLGRAGRIRWYLAALGQRVSLWQAFVLNTWGDAAAGLTPMRFGGEMAKFAGLLRAGVPPRIGVLALGLEAAITYPIVALFGGWLAWRFAPAWWEAARPAVQRALATDWPWAVALAVVVLLAGLVMWFARGRTAHVVEAGAFRAVLRQAAAGPLAAGAAVSLYNVAARTLMLPVLALALPEHPPFGVMMVGSFLLLYSQLVLPTPAGVGAVELGFLAGLAGDLGAGGGRVLVAWRFYTVGAGAALGVILAVSLLGIRPAVRAVGRAVGRRAT
jgi:uncharacterized membrane protein YbhN (UPF0104 family)